MTRLGYTLVSYFAVLFTLAVTVFHPRPDLIWNASASAPIGLYAIRPTRHPVRGVLLAITPPAPIARLAAVRRYLPLGVPLLKTVAAVPGQKVCRLGAIVTIDGAPTVRALANDRRGRPLPVWQGCRVIADGEVFVMNAAVWDSFDSRYFGPIPFTAVIGRASPLWLQTPSLRAVPSSPPAASAQPKEPQP